ncbi:class I SAM-dependent methyltransferase [bacterium]|nr:class I SAM-dependent methyltransferase [bacterium]
MAESSNHAELMDSVYRYQRYIYNITRKFYLLGRDSLIDEMDLKPGERILEMGCGTARNLILFSKKNTEVLCYGIDASQEMLDTAQVDVNRAGVSERITLKQALAEQVTHQGTFGLEQPFDAVFFSYSLSMIPTWKDAIQTALDNLKPGGMIYIVDFWDQGGWPQWFQALLRWWLSLFHVKHEPELLDYIKTFEDKGAGKIEIDSVFRRYAFKTRLKKTE